MSNTLPFPLNPLHPGLVVPKPINEDRDGRMEELEAADQLLLQRKRDGHEALLTSTGTRRREIGIYSRAIKDRAANFPDLVEELCEIQPPHGTFLCSEMHVDVDGVDLPEQITSFAGTKDVEEAIAKQREHAPVQLSIFNVLMYKGALTVDLPYRNRFDIIGEILAKHRSRNVHLVQVVDLPLAQAQALSIRKRWEGLVGYDLFAKTIYRLDGNHANTPRPKGVWKWKELPEIDVAITGWNPSDAVGREGLIRDLNMALRHPTSGEFVHVGVVDKGLSLDQRDKLRDPKLYPMVARIIYERRTKNLRFIKSKIDAFRDDKTPDECILPIPFV